MIYNILSDKQPFDKKPNTKEAGEIQNRLKKKHSNEVTFKELVKLIEKGHSLKYGVYEKNFKLLSRDLFVFDIDSGEKIEDWELLFKSLGIDIFILYKTFSHTEEKNRFRIIIKLNFSIKSKEFYAALFNAFDEIFIKAGHVQDKSLKDWTKLVYGSNQKVVIANEFSRPLDITQFFDDVVYSRSLQEEEIKDYLIDGMFAIKKREKFFDVNSKVTRDIELTGDFTAFEQYLRAYFRAYGKPEYTTALKWASGLSNAKMHDLYYDTIPEHKLKEYIGFERTLNNGKKPFYTKFFKELYDKFLKDNFQVEKYLSEGQLNLVLNSPEKNILMVAPTGTGKTHGLVNILKKRGDKFIFAVPSVGLVEQGHHTFNIKGCSEKQNIIDNHSGLIPSAAFCTYNKLADIDKAPGAYFGDHILIIDECHLLALTSDYRGDIIYRLLKVKDRFKKIIFVTATHEIYPAGTFEKTIEFISKDDKQYEANFIKIPKKIKIADTVNEIIEKSRATKFLVFNPRDKKMNNALCLELKKAISFNADTKQSQEHTDFIRTGLYPPRRNTIIATDIFSAGVNILEKDVRVAVITSGDIDKSTLKQLVARFRLAEIVEIYYIYKEERDGLNFNPFNYINKEVEKNLEKYNKFGQVTNTDLKPFEIKDDFYIYNKELKKFEIFQELVYRKAYKTYCSNCDLVHLFDLFPKDNISFSSCFFDIEKAVVIEKGGAGRKSKEDKERIANEQFSLLLKEEYELVEDDVLEKFKSFKLNNLSHHLCCLLASGKLELDKVRAFVMCKNLKGLLATHMIKDNFYCMVEEISKKTTGRCINANDICKKNKTFKLSTLKIIIEAIWQTQEMRDGNKRYLKLLKRKNFIELVNKSDEKELIKNKYILGLQVGL